jgi:hypothetical protein
MGLWNNVYLALSGPTKAVRPVFKYAMLGFTLLLLGANIYWRINLPRGYQGDRYVNFVVALMLLFNVLAFQFRWPVLATVLLRTLAFMWIAFAFVYITVQSGHLALHHG